MIRPVDAWTWYIPLGKQLRLERRNALIEVAQPSAADLRLLSVVRKLAHPTPKDPEYKETTQ